jgi:uncharacterized protein
MHFAIVCLDKPGHGTVRAENRPAHLAHLKAHEAQILVAGPLLGDDGQAPVGSLLVMDFGDPEAARKFADDDPYAKAGLFQSVDIRPWRKVFPAS